MLELAKDYRVIAVDTRGMGESERPESGYDTQTVANDLSDLMRRLGIDHYSVIGCRCSPLAASWAPARRRSIQ